MNLKGKKIIVGVSGGIAVYKSCYLVSALVKNGAQVRVVMTEAAQKFVAPLTFQTLSKNKVVTGLFDCDEYDPQHVEMAEWAELAVIAPATANIIAKAAQGLADDALSTLLVSMECPVLFAPAMNYRMFRNPAVQKNVEILREFGHYIIGPETGRLACGEGVGRMSEPEAILKSLDILLKKLKKSK